MRNLEDITSWHVLKFRPISRKNDSYMTTSARQLPGLRNKLAPSLRLAGGDGVPQRSSPFVFGVDLPRLNFRVGG